MHAGSIQARLLGILAIGVICSTIACSGGGGSAAAAAAPTLTPPAAIGLLITPSTTEINAGEHVALTATVTGTTDTSVTWTVDGIPGGNAAVGTISGSGSTISYVAPDTAGTHVLTATSLVDSSKRATSNVHVKPVANAVIVDVSPATTTLTIGTTQSFVATVMNAADTRVTWFVDGVQNGNGASGFVTGSGNTVTYTAPSLAGSHTLQAVSVADVTKSASASITVQAPPTAVSVSLTPASTTLLTGGSATFNAVVSGSANTAVSVNVDGIPNGNAAVGTVSGSGSGLVYTAPATAGSHLLEATAAADITKKASSTITVQAPVPTVGVTLSPASSSLSTGSSASFTVAVTGTTNSAVTWSVDGVINGNSSLGTVTGSGSTASYAAPASAGSHTLTATSVADPGKSASSTIVVLAPPPPASLTVNPNSTTVNTGATASFTATLSGSAGTTVTWKVDGVANGNTSVGTISGTGNTVTYTAPATAGSHSLVATSLADGSSSIPSTITVQTPPPPVSVALSPGTASVVTGSTLVLTANVTGSSNTAVSWFVDGNLNGLASVGVLTGSGSTRTYTAPSGTGTHTITATSAADASKTAIANITVTAPVSITSVVVSPTTVALNVGSQNQFTATVGGTGSYSSALTWTAQRGSVTSTGLYTAPASGGSDVITATSVADSTKKATSNITVMAPASVTSVSVSPGAVTLSGGAQNQFSAAVSGTGSYSTAVTWTAQRGSITSTGLYTAPATAGGDVVTATSVGDATRSGVAAVTVQVAAAPSGIIVAPNGVLGNPGTVASPTTLEGARTLIQNASRATAGTLRVLLRGGIYPRSSSFTLTAADSGTAANPVEYAAYPNETPRLIGGVAVNPASIRLVDGTDPNWARLDATARPLIYVVDLTAYKASMGTLNSRSDAGGITNQSMEVFVNGAPLTLARYPKAVDKADATIAPHASIRVSGTLTPNVTGDYAYKGLDNQGRPYYQLSKNGDLWSIAGSATSPNYYLSNRRDLGGTGSSASWGTWDTFAGPAGSFISGSGASGTAFLSPADGSDAVPGFMLIRSTNGTTQITAVPDSRMSRWRASEAMYFGLGFFSWSASHSTISALDPTTGAITLPSSPEYGFRVGQPFFVYNLLEELTAPGDYFLDRVNARLYLRPVGDVVPTELLISTLQTPVVQMTGCQKITWQGISFEVAKNLLVSGSSCQSVTFRNCQFSNAGGYGLSLDGYSNLVDACDFQQLGKGGVTVSGGSRATLTPSGTVVQNCEIHHFGRLFWTYQPGINISYTGMGLTAQNNEIHHCPHAAILFGGNENTIKNNLIHNATQWANDSGVIYTTGRDWGTQGNLIQFNLIRNCGGPLGTFLSGIYIDGVGSGVKIEGNILYYAAPQFAMQHNGGRDVKMQYNIFYGHYYGIDISNVGFEVVNNTSGSSWDLLGKLIAMNYQAPPWSTAYPHVAVIPNTWAQLQGTRWIQPEGSVCYGNLQTGRGSSVYVQHNSEPALAAPITWFSQVGANLSQVDPMFTDAANLDFRLQPGSPMFNIPGFPGIDVTRIGIQR